MDTKTVMTDIPSTKSYLLSDTWVLWAHLPHVTDWSLSSYIKIMEIKELNDILSLYKSIPDKMIKNCMLFVMKDKITPLWEDENNRNGGCFSYKIANNDVPNVWKNLCYLLVGETLSKKKANITGLTISPKKNFCIIKIWLGDCNNQNPQDINYFNGIDAQGCLFKKHLPEY